MSRRFAAHPGAARVRGTFRRELSRRLHPPPRTAPGSAARARALACLSRPWSPRAPRGCVGLGPAQEPGSPPPVCAARPNRLRAGFLQHSLGAAHVPSEPATPYPLLEKDKGPGPGPPAFNEQSPRTKCLDDTFGGTLMDFQSHSNTAPLDRVTDRRRNYRQGSPQADSFAGILPRTINPMFCQFFFVLIRVFASFSHTHNQVFPLSVACRAFAYGAPSRQAAAFRPR